MPFGLAITQHHAVSIDGVRIPYFQIGRADLPLDGSTACLLGGYGGFQIASLPYYSLGVGKQWLERGGVQVIANIRGGGEFGPGWHKAGMREGKKLAHDDFAAVAQDLIARGVTRRERLACSGGSNGGLLVGNMLTRYPHLFGAIYCAVPLLDMRRYTKLPPGASWIGEYGDPDKPEDWAFLQEMSAYHHVEPDRDYPPILLPRPVATTAFIPATPARWPRSSRRSAIRSISTSRPTADMPAPPTTDSSPSI